MKIDTPELLARIEELGAQITHDYAGMFPVLIGTLKGSGPFFGHLLVAIDPWICPVEIDYISAYSYSGERTSSGIVRIEKDLRTDIEGRHVLLIDDVLDTGETFKWLMNFMAARDPASLETCVLVRKDIEPNANVRPKYVGFVIPNEFIVGFGLDYQERWRNLPYICSYDEIEKRETQ